MKWILVFDGEALAKRRSLHSTSTYILTWQGIDPTRNPPSACSEPPWSTIFGLR